MPTTDPTRHETLTAAKQRVILSNKDAAHHPQPADYGLTYYDLHLDELDLEPCRRFDDGLRYKQYTKCTWLNWKCSLAILFVVYSVVFVALAPHIRGVTLGDAITLYVLGMALFGFYGMQILPAAMYACIAHYMRRHSRAAILAYEQALHDHQLYKAALYKAEQALLRQKQSYWEGLNGYEFEVATAEVLKRYQFNPRVTRGSADGGVDIEVTRAGQKGVVQCKAHAACVGPHTVRDLFGVMHHSSSKFGIIVSRSGFTKGASDFARDKPIFLVDTSDLIAMEEGRDVLAGGFTRTET